jgi:hypothetical protein
MKLLAVLLGGCLIGLGCTVQPASTPTTIRDGSSNLLRTSQAQSSGSSLSVPSGGISEARAIELASRHTSLLTFVSAAAGPFRESNIQPGIGLDYPIKPDQLVWAVTYSGDVTVCGPIANCFSPRPATIAVFLDYWTGDFLSSATTALAL